MAAAIVEMLARAQSHPHEIEATARAEAVRLFATGRVCEQISVALQELVSSAKPTPAGQLPR
jgi:hypothetical protein